MRDYLYYADPGELFDFCKDALRARRGAAARLRAVRIHHRREEERMSRCSSSAPASAEVVHFCFIRDIRVPVAGFTVDAAYLEGSELLRPASGRLRGGGGGEVRAGGSAWA